MRLKARALVKFNGRLFNKLEWIGMNSHIRRYELKTSYQIGFVWFNNGMDFIFYFYYLVHF